jgi:hypothetical protein
MTRISKPLLAAIVAVGALAATSAAQARSDVHLSIGVGVPVGYGYVQPAPVYVEPQPVYVQPRTVYVQPQPVYYYEGQHRHHGRHNAWRDADRDGVPNRYDRAPNNPYRY